MGPRLKMCQCYCMANTKRNMAQESVKMVFSTLAIFSLSPVSPLRHLISKEVKEQLVKRNQKKATKQVLKN